MSKSRTKTQNKSRTATAAGEQTLITTPTPGMNETIMIMGGQLMGGSMGYSKPDEIGTGKLQFVQAKVFDRGATISEDPPSGSEVPPVESSDNVNWSTGGLDCATGGDKTLAVWGTFSGGVTDLDKCDFYAFSMDVGLVAARARTTAARWPQLIPKKLFAYVGRNDAPRRQHLGRFLDAGLVARDAIVLRYNRQLSKDDDAVKIWEAEPTAARPAYWQLRVRKHVSHFTAALLLKNLPDSTLPDDLIWAHLWTFSSANRLRRQHTITEPVYITVHKRAP